MTQLADLFNPQVLTAMVSAQLPKRIAFSGIAPIDTTLQGQPGNTVTLPRYKYIGDAQDVAEGAQIDMESLTVATQTATIKKAGIGIMLTDEAVLSAYGDPQNEAVRQIAMSLASKVDNDVLATAKTATLQMTDSVDLDLPDKASAKFIDNVSDFNSEQNDTATGVLFLNPKDANALRKLAGSDWTRSSELGDTIITSGNFGELFGWEINRTRKLAQGEYILALPGAMKTYIKRNAMIETARDIKAGLTNITGNEHYVTAIVDDSKILYGKTASAPSAG